MSVKSSGPVLTPIGAGNQNAPSSFHVSQASFADSTRSTPGSSGFGHKTYQGSRAFWSVGEFVRPSVTHQSVGLTLANDNDDAWDLSDSLADLFNEVNRRGRGASSQQVPPLQSKSSARGGHHEDGKHVDVDRWIAEDTSHGFIRVFNANSECSSQLYPCTLSTTAQKICMQMGVANNSLHVQFNGDIIRRMEPFDCPLAVQNEYLASIGYSDSRRIQDEGSKEELSYMIKFYSGKPVSDSTYSRNQLCSNVYIRKGKLLHQWVRRVCSISGTRLLICREKGAKPTVVQLAKGSVEEIQIKGQMYVLKLTSTLQGERSIYLSFTSHSDYSKWHKKLKKATSKLPTKADLSGCDLEFIPETVFINDDLQILVLRHNVLRERPIEEDIYTIGWLDDLPRFTALRSLNLADNDLRIFPMALCLIKTLVELNVASNKLEEVPPQVTELTNLQVFHLHNNQLSTLPEEMSTMRNLAIVVLAFNNFATIPTVLLQSQHAQYQIDSLIMAGNAVSRLPTDQLMYMTHIKKVDLRMNKLQLLPTETAKFQSLEHITHMDIRDNQVLDLDIRAIRSLEYLNCDHNGMKSLQVNGTSLKNLFASHNNLEVLSISPKPEWLINMNVSHNKLTSLPSWVSDCFFLVHLDVSHNCLQSLSDKLFTDALKLKILKAHHNQLTVLTSAVQNSIIEELHLQHNEIKSLSPELFIQTSRLRYLNITCNKLCDLPPPHPNDTFNKLQELYLSFNNLGNAAMAKVCCFPRLRVLHMACNKISVIEERDLEKLEQLQEFNISSNILTYLPSCLGRHPHLQVLRANCNLLQELPSFKNSSALKVLEVSSNHLHSVSMSNLMTSQVNLLDISGNPNLQVPSYDLEGVKKSKRLCMVDMRGQNWSLQDLRTIDEPTNMRPWISGLSQTSGIRNKLSVAIINKPAVSEKGDALFAIVDGGRNDEVAKAIADNLVQTLQKEELHQHTSSDYMKYTILTAHRQLKSLGQKLGAAVALVHITRRQNLNTQASTAHHNQGQEDKTSQGGWIVRTANVGDTEVVLCHHGRAVALTRLFDIGKDGDECHRVVKSGGIITEDGRVNGVTFNTRLLGSSYLFPYVIPDPHTTYRQLEDSDHFLILANQGLWKVVTHEEAVREIRDISDPVVAAKRLQDLAQGYGSRENVAVVVVRLMLSESEWVRVKESLAAQRESQKELLRVLSQQADLLELRDGVPPTPELSNVVIDRAGRAKKTKAGSFSSPTKGEPSHSQQDSNQSVHFDQNSSQQLHTHQRGENAQHSKSTGQVTSKRYRKKDSPNMWESVLSKRLAEEVKSKELKHAFLSGGEADEAEAALKNVVDFKSQEVANWRAETKRRRGEGPEEWSRVMQERLAQEVKQREIKRELGVDKESKDAVVVQKEGSNWSSLTSDKVQSRKIMTPTEPSLGFDGNDNREETDTSSSMPDISPPPPPPRPPRPGKSSKSGELSSSRSHRPPPPLPPHSQPSLSPHMVQSVFQDSLVSLDDFTREPMYNADIDRDAILFHQMQMTRAHSGSNASLTSIQSDPMYASVRDVFSPGPQASSHSIEVLVNSPTVDHHRFFPYSDKTSSEPPLENTSDGEGGFSDSDNSDSATVVADGFDVTIEALYDHIRDYRRDSLSKANVWDGEMEEDRDVSTKTLTGEIRVVGDCNGTKQTADVEELYATVNKARKMQGSANKAPSVPIPKDSTSNSEMCNTDSDVYLTPSTPLFYTDLNPSPSFVNVPPPPPPPPPPLTKIQDSFNKLSNQKSIIITYL